MGFYGWRPYVPVARRQAQAKKKIETLRKKGKVIEPIEIEGRAIAKSFWGQAWCDHLELFSDFENRLPRGRTYVRNGSVCHLEIQKGKIEAIVCGSELYTVSITIHPLRKAVWESIKHRCAGKIGSMLELLQGKLSDHVMKVVTNPKEGLMPLMGEIKLKCSCPDWADMCKHVAAVLYGVGSRLDQRPELLFTLRGVKAEELIATGVRLPTGGAGTEPAIADDQLADIFGIELEEPAAAVAAAVAEEQHPNIRFPADKAAERRKQEAIKNAAQPVASEKQPTKRKTAGKKAVKKVVPKEGGVMRVGFKAALSTKAKRAWTGRAVARLRKRLGFSAKQMAEQLGMSAAIVNRWEKTPGRLNLQRRSQQALEALAETTP